MRKIINSTYVTLDGVVEKPDEWPPAGEDTGEGDAIQTELLFQGDARQGHRPVRLRATLVRDDGERALG